MEEARDAVPDGQGKGTGWGLWPADAVAAEAAGLPAGKESRENEAVAVGGILTLHITVDFFDTCIHVA